MKVRHSDICVICGKNPVTGRDHLPPQCIFPKPRPSDLITVPACDGCNNKRSGLDEEFKVAIGIQAGHGEEGERRFHEQTSRTLSYNRRLRGEIASTMKEVEIRSPAGLVLGSAMAVLLRSNSYDLIINRIIKGLHWHHTGYILGDDVDVTVYWHQNLDKKTYDMAKNWATGIVGDGQFIYKYAIFDEAPMASAWILQFFECAWSSGIILPKLEP